MKHWTLQQRQEQWRGYCDTLLDEGKRAHATDKMAWHYARGRGAAKRHLREFAALTDEPHIEAMRRRMSAEVRIYQRLRSISNARDALLKTPCMTCPAIAMCAELRLACKRFQFWVFSEVLKPVEEGRIPTRKKYEAVFSNEGKELCAA